MVAVNHYIHRWYLLLYIFLVLQLPGYSETTQKQHLRITYPVMSMYSHCIHDILRWAGHVARMGEERGVYRVLVGKPEGRRPLGRPRRRWADNMRLDLQEVGCVYRDWIGLAQDRDRWRTLVSAVMNLRVP